MTFLTLIITLAVVAVLLVGAMIGLLRPSRRRRREAPPAGTTGVRLADSPTPTTDRPGSGRTPSTRDHPAVDRPGDQPSVDQPSLDRPSAGGPGVADPLAEPSIEQFELDRPEPAAGRLARLRTRLRLSQTSLGRGLLGLLSRDRVDEDTWDEVEEVLITADVGVGPTQELVARLRSRVKALDDRSPDARSPEAVRTLLREELLVLVDVEADRSLRTAGGGRPTVVLVVGVNGTGKTTTVGKLARVLVAEGHTVLLAAADTFRAAAADQLQTWGERVGAPTVRGPEGGDPASVAYDAVRQGADGGYDTVLIDTAGRLQNKVGLMDELGKVKRVVEKHGPVDEVLLVLDATTGQNGLVQARVFAEVVDVTGIVLTKLDGTAKGGIVVAVQRELGVPVKLVGLGEGVDDLAPFEPEAFVEALIGP